MRIFLWFVGGVVVGVVLGMMVCGGWRSIKSYLGGFKGRLVQQHATFSLGKEDTTKLIHMLNCALADEWFAYYQYWIGAHVAQGSEVKAVIKELNEHAEEEFAHADMLVERIKQLGGTPLLDPAEWKAASGCGFLAPRDYDVLPIIKQNLKGEVCAVESYKKTIDFIGDRDSISTLMLKKILADEEKHISDLEGLLNKIGK